MPENSTARRRTRRPPAAEPPADGAGPPMSGLEDGIGRLAWVAPAELAGHPDNCRVHSPDQYQAVLALIRRNGWVEPLVFNEANGLLVDGHCRLKIALDHHVAKVPVVYGRWSDAQHAELLALLDPSSAQATIDRAALARLRARLSLEPGGPLARLADSLHADPFFRRGAAGAAELLGQAPHPAGNPPLALPDGTEGPDPDGPNDDARDAPPEPWDTPLLESHVRMAQLFFDATTFAEYNALVDRLMAPLGADDPTTTVLLALRAAAERLPGPGPQPA
jgi:hypothetical protein